MKRFVIVVFLTVTVTQQSQLEGPQNTLSIVGSNVTLKCSSPSRNCSGIDWQKYLSGATPMTIFKNSRILNTNVSDRNRYSVDNSSGCDLVIRNVTLTDAGRFVCSAIISSSQTSRTAYLIILETQPRCTLNASLNGTVEGDVVQLNCAMSHSATKGASMNWKGVTDAPGAVKNGNTLSRSYSVVASAPEVPSLTCVTSFALETSDNGVSIVGSATNKIPNATCTTSAIKLHCLQCSTADTTNNQTTTNNHLPLSYIMMTVAVGILILIILLIVCFYTEACPVYKFYNSRMKSKGKSRDEQPRTENPDVIYSVVNKGQDSHHKAKSPKRPKDPPPQPTAGHTDVYQHEEVTYADLAMEYGPRKVVPQNLQAAQEETLYAAVTIA